MQVAVRSVRVLAQLEMRSVAKARGLTYMASIDVAVMMAIIYNDDQWWCIISYNYIYIIILMMLIMVMVIVVLMVVVFMVVVIMMMILMGLDYSNKWLQFKPILLICSSMRGELLSHCSCAQLCAHQQATVNWWKQYTPCWCDVCGAKKTNHCLYKTKKHNNNYGGVPKMGIPPSHPSH